MISIAILGLRNHSIKPILLLLSSSHLPCLPSSHPHPLPPSILHPSLPSLLPPSLLANQSHITPTRPPESHGYRPPPPPVLQLQWAGGRGGHCAILGPDGSHEPPVDRRQVRTPPSHVQGVALGTSRVEREITGAAQQRAAPVRRRPARRPSVDLRVPARDPVVMDMTRDHHRHSWYTESLNTSWYTVP